MSSVSEDKYYPTIIALAGVFQATALVEQLARTGYLPMEAYRSSVQSLFEQNPDTVESVFGDRTGIALGLKVLSNLLLEHRQKEYMDALRYTLGIFHLERKLARNKDMLSIIGTRLGQARQQADHFGDTVHENVVANLAGIYSDTISTFRFRIQVVGDYTYLQQQRVANQVRALLFAAVRAALLWRQTGGNRLQLIFKRRRLAQTAAALLKEIS